jgi:hypothetical protein
MIGRKDGVVAELIVRPEKTERAGLVIYFQNTGHLPAKFNWGLTRDIQTAAAWQPGGENIIKLPILFQPMARSWDPKTRTTHEFRNDKVIAGDSTVTESVVDFPRHQLETVFNTTDPAIIVGNYEFCDGFGNLLVRHFMIYYAYSPYRAFRLNSTDETGRVPSPRPIPFLNPRPGVEQLNPCDPSRQTAGGMHLDFSPIKAQQP